MHRYNDYWTSRGDDWKVYRASFGILWSRRSSRIYYVSYRRDDLAVDLSNDHRQKNVKGYLLLALAFLFGCQRHVPPEQSTFKRYELARGHVHYGFDGEIRGVED